MCGIKLLIGVLGFVSGLKDEPFSIRRGMCNYRDPCFKSELVNATCTIEPSAPIIGPIKCICPPGFEGDGLQEGTQCTDVDECSKYPRHHPRAACRNPFEHCVNDFGSYHCLCDPGYQPNPNRSPGCIDINECLYETMNVCDEMTQVCENLPGTYRCVCRDPTHIQDPISHECRAVNVCTDAGGILNPCDPVSSDCKFDPLVGAHCQCKEGFRFNQRTQQCTDIDECAENVHQCPSLISVCENTVGSYTCKCDEISGYSVDPASPFNCVPFNECERWPAICGDLPCCKDLLPAYPPVPFSGFTCAESLLDSFSPVAPSANSFVPYVSSFNPSVTPPSDIFSASSLSALQGRQLADFMPDHTHVSRDNMHTSRDGASAQWEDFDPGNELANIAAGSIPVIDAAMTLLGDAARTVARLGIPERCPAGYVNLHAVLRALARDRAGNVLTGLISTPFRMDSEMFGRGIVQNTEIFTEDLIKWTSTLASIPQAFSVASANLTQAVADPQQGDFVKAVKSSADTGGNFLKGIAQLAPLFMPQPV